MKLALFVVMVLGFAFSGCNSSSGGGSKDGGVDAQGCGGAPAVAASQGNGCYIRMIQPANCETIDLSNGQTYVLEWTTDGTTCETPWKVALAGNPVTAENAREFSVSTNNDNITTKNGRIEINAATLEGYQSNNGTYHWLVSSFYGSHPASIQFKVKK